MYRLGLIGYPLGHSLSPVIHQAALQAMDLPGEYQLFPIAPLPAGQLELNELLGRLRRGDLDGLNVTIPHKTSLLPLLDGLTPTASGIGAVNTLYWEGRHLLGDNTDAPGFMSELERLGLNEPGRALVMGAGGSARSVVFALANAGWQVAIAARRLDQAEALTAGISQPLENRRGSSGQPIHSPQAVRLLPHGLQAALPVDLIVNTTPVGMTPLIEGSPWPASLPLPAEAAVIDLIYNPAETLLLGAARQAGLKTANGLGMLVEQAALSLERWTGQSVPRPAMWQSLQGFILASQAAQVTGGAL